MNSLAEKCAVYKKTLVNLNKVPDLQAQKRIIYQVNQMIHFCLKEERDLKISQHEADSLDLIIKTPSNLSLRISNIIKILDKIEKSQFSNFDLVRLDVYTKQVYEDLQRHQL